MADDAVAGGAGVLSPGLLRLAQAHAAYIHAREAITIEVLLHFMHHLTDNYGTDQRVTDIVDGRELWFEHKLSRETNDAKCAVLVSRAISDRHGGRGFGGRGGVGHGQAGG